MTIAESVRPGRNPLPRLLAALTDPARCERAMTPLLVAYAAAWSLYGAIAKGSQDINFDMGEMYAWSREADFGTPKHPPLGAWLVRAWFTVFPREDWAYYLFAVVLGTLALWIAWRVSARYLPPQKRAVGIMLLTLVPFYNFHALKFNANTVLIPFWAATTWWFLRSFETRRTGWAILAGIGAAAAMLGKYWSAFLLAGLVIAALADPRRGAYFRSWTPWLTIAAGAIVLTPHVLWVVAHDFAPFHYAMQEHAATLAAAARAAAEFIAGTIGYSAAPIIIVMLAARPSLAAIGDSVWPADPDRRTAIVAFAAPLILAALAALVLRVEIVSLWAMSAVTLLPVVLLSSPLIEFSRAAAVRLLAVAIVFPLIMIAASPVIALVIHHQGVQHYATQYRLVAQAVERVWREHTDAPLRIVGSYTNAVNGIAFYVSAAPATYDIIDPGQTPWVGPDRIKRDGIAMACPQPEAACVQAMNAISARYPGGKSETVVLARSFFGTPDQPVRYEILIVPPQP